jgi:hypothetical protein
MPFNALWPGISGPPVSDFPVLELKACSTTPSFQNHSCVDDIIFYEIKDSMGIYCSSLIFHVKENFNFIIVILKS